MNQLEKMITEKIKNITDAIETLPVPDAKPLLQTLVDKVILIAEKEIEIGLHLL